MSESTPYRIILCTCPDADTAEGIAGALVAEGVAACVNIVPGIRSVYLWKGQVERDDELLLIVKSRADRYTAVEAIIRSRHPYELPEVVCVPIDTGLPAYLAWIDDSVTPNS